jgi:hypothetical protein
MTLGVVAENLTFRVLRRIAGASNRKARTRTILAHEVKVLTALLLPPSLPLHLKPRPQLPE